MPKQHSEKNPPAIATSEWARRNHLNESTVKGWVLRGDVFPAGRVWHSGGRDYLIRPDEPVPPAPKPTGRPRGTPKLQS